MALISQPDTLLGSYLQLTQLFNFFGPHSVLGLSHVFCTSYVSPFGPLQYDSANQYFRLGLLLVLKKIYIKSQFDHNEVWYFTTNSTLQQFLKGKRACTIMSEGYKNEEWFKSNPTIARGRCVPQQKLRNKLIDEGSLKEKSFVLIM